MWKKIKNNLFKVKPNTIEYIIVGLGNPGEKYRKTTHNVGFRVIDYLQEKGDFPNLEKNKYLNALSSKGKLEEKEVVLLLPQTFMNLSGVSVKKSLNHFNIRHQHLIVVHDDTDLSLGLIRFSFSKGSAGHKGVESIIKNIKTKNFIRVRVGVSKKGEKAENIVLKNVPSISAKIEQVAAEEIIKSLSNNIFSKTININTKEKHL